MIQFVFTKMSETQKGLRWDREIASGSSKESVWERVENKSTAFAAITMLIRSADHPPCWVLCGPGEYLTEPLPG